MRSIPLSSRKYPGLAALVDDADYEWLSEYSWCPDKRSNGFYARAWVEGRLQYMHKLILPTSRTVDHEDRNTLNNQRYNLREADGSQQQANRKRGRRKSGVVSQYKGVYRHSQQECWRVELGARGTRKHVGIFQDEVEAAKAYDKAAVEMHGKFAYTNFPQKEDDSNQK